MRVLVFLLLASAALGQAEVSSQANFNEVEQRPVIGQRVRWVTDPVVRFSEQNRATRRVIDKTEVAAKKVDPIQGWHPWAPPDVCPANKGRVWPKGVAAGYCKGFAMPLIGGGGEGAPDPRDVKPPSPGSDYHWVNGYERDGSWVNGYWARNPGSGPIAGENAIPTAREAGPRSQGP